MDNNMNVVDYNNIGNNNMDQGVQPQPVPMPEVAPNPFEMPQQPTPNPFGMQQQPVSSQPVGPGQVPVQPVESQTVNPVQNVDGNIMNQTVEAPTIDVNQTPTEVFGAPVNEQPVNDPNVQTIVPPIGPEEAVQPKYGYMTNEDKPNLNTDSNANIKFIIFLAILMLGFIVALPYLSNMLG